MLELPKWRFAYSCIVTGSTDWLHYSVDMADVTTWFVTILQKYSIENTLTLSHCFLMHAGSWSIDSIEILISYLRLRLKWLKAFQSHQLQTLWRCQHATLMGVLIAWTLQFVWFRKRTCQFLAITRILAGAYSLLTWTLLKWNRILKWIWWVVLLLIAWSSECLLSLLILLDQSLLR